MTIQRTNVVYSDYEHTPLGSITFTARMHQNPEAVLAEVASVLKQVDAQVPIAEISTAEAQMEESLERERMLATLSATLGILAVLVAMIGLCGLLAYSITRRTREIGIRIALGAGLGQLQWLAIRDGMALLLCGVAIGFPSYLAFSRIFRAQVYGATPGDPFALTAALGLLVLCAGSAIYFPARRSARVNPVEALKYE